MKNVRSSKGQMYSNTFPIQCFANKIKTTIDDESITIETIFGFIDESKRSVLFNFDVLIHDNDLLNINENAIRIIASLKN